MNLPTGAKERQIETFEKLTREKSLKIERHNKRQEEYKIKHHDAFVAEGLKLMTEIDTLDVNDKWQYRKGLRLMYLGTMVKKPEWKEIGHRFYKQFSLTT